jgi:HK97 gp10 family phage protein
MSKTAVEWPGWEQHKKAYLAKIAGQVAANMDAAAGYAADQARQLAPVYRGILKSDITHVVKARGNTIEGFVGVKKRAFWARFVELGTSKMKAQPFLRPAVFNNINKIRNILLGKG